MIGLPTETDDDLDAIRDMTVAMRDIMMKHARPRGHVGRIVGSVNPLIPKPGTAYQWLPMEDPAITDRKGKRLRHLLSGIDNVYFNIKSERHSYYQALLSLGDRRVRRRDRGRRAQRRQLARCSRRGRARRGFLHLPRPIERHRAAVGHHRRRHEGLVLPVRVPQVPSRGVDAPAEAAEREPQALAGAGLVLSEGLRPSDSLTRALARRFAGSRRSRGSLRCARSRRRTARTYGGFD